MLERWFFHSQERAMERYGINLTLSLEQTIREAIVKGAVNRLGGIPGTNRAVYRMLLDNQIATLVFCEDNKRVVTFLQNGWVQGTPIECMPITIKQKSCGSKKPKRKNTAHTGGKYKSLSGKHKKVKSPRLPQRPPEEVFDEF